MRKSAGYLINIFLYCAVPENSPTHPMEDNLGVSKAKIFKGK